MRRNLLVGLLAAGFFLPVYHCSAQFGGSGGSGGSGGFGGSTGGFGSTSGGFGGASRSSGGGTAGGFGTTGTGGFGSGSMGGFGSTGSGFSGGFGSTSGAGSFTGGGGFGGTRAGIGGRTTYGQTTPYGQYYANPLALGLASATAGGANQGGGRYLRPYPVTLTFGQPLYNTASIATTTLGSTGFGTTGLGLGSTFPGVNTSSIRRAPAYITEPVFDVPNRPTVESVRSDLQSIIDRSSRLPSRGSIRVVADGDTIILRGRVRDDKERRLAEAVVRLSPGVRAVKNELRAPSSQR